MVMQTFESVEALHMTVQHGIQTLIGLAVVAMALLAVNLYELRALRKRCDEEDGDSPASDAD